MSRFATAVFVLCAACGAEEPLSLTVARGVGVIGESAGSTDCLSYSGDGFSRGDTPLLSRAGVNPDCAFVFVREVDFDDSETLLMFTTRYWTAELGVPVRDQGLGGPERFDLDGTSVVVTVGRSIPFELSQQIDADGRWVSRVVADGVLEPLDYNRETGRLLLEVRE